MGRPRPYHALLAGIALPLCALLVCACNRSVSPAEEIRQLLARMEEAAEEKDVVLLKEHIADGYRDEEGRTKQDLKGILAYYFLQNRSIHLLTRISRIELPAPERAEVSVFVAMAGTQIPDAGWLPRVSADLYRFELILQRIDSEWKLTSAAWHPASENDFK